MKQVNTFNEGLNMDISDYLLRNTMSRNCKNMRLLDLDGTSYAITTIRGTELSFTLSSGYVPIASTEYNDVLYIFSGKPNVDPNIKKYESFELGSFYSPNYPSGGSSVEAYAPFQNLEDSDFRVGDDIWDIEYGQFVDMSIQPEYDQSVNVIITAENNPPRIINSGFNKDFEITERRSGANTNDYTNTSVDTETRLVLRSQQITNISYGDIENGGRLLAGNYVYAFRYMTADFNETDVFNQSGICSVFEGYSETKYAASVNSETTKRVRLLLSNIDTSFAYVKVYFQYSTGENSVDQRVFEIVQPISITSDELTFTHDGYEETQEVSTESITLDFTAFDSVTSNTQAKGYLLVGGVKQRAINYESIAAAIQTVTARVTEAGDQTLTGFSPYTNPENIYSYLSSFSGETYPYGIVVVLGDGSTTPVFPIQGYDSINWSSLTTIQQDAIKAKGLFRYPEIDTNPFLSSGNVIPKGIVLTLSNIPQSIKDDSIGFFIVRGERKNDMISQGIVIPTMRVPNNDYGRSTLQADFPFDGKTYYPNFDSESAYKSFPIIDGLIEPWYLLDEGSGSGIQTSVVDPNKLNEIKGGYMPTIINTDYTIPGFNPELPGDVNIKSAFRWAYYSADYILNQARYITALQRSNIGYKQWKKVEMESVSEGQISDKYTLGDYATETSLLYKFTGFQDLAIPSYSKAIESLDFVPSSTFATGNDFISALSHRVRGNPNSAASGPGAIEYVVRSFVDGYFGMKLGQLDVFAGVYLNEDPWKQPYNPPLVGNGGASWNNEVEGPRYNNIGRKSYQGYLISIYPRATGEPIEDINNLYDSIDGITYHQISDRLTWDQAGSELIVFGGDCYIGEVHKKLNRSGYTDPQGQPDQIQIYSDDHADNINQGVVFSFVHESEYNQALRLPYLGDISDPEDRSFYPYRNGNNINKFREYRLEETERTNQGFGETERPKTFLTLPSNVPFIASNFFTRIVHSEKHVPNAFQNGYRSFVGVNYEDYDPAMGEIVRLFTHRDQLFVVFEHGIGIGPVSQRIQTGSDTAGAIFVEPSGVLPPYLSFASQVIGSQHGNATIQTPSAVYGVDVSRRKIWQFREGLVVISDNGFQSYMDKLDARALKNPRMGYDPNYHEVIFTFGEDGYEWTLCFKEGLERFTSFYSYFGEHYAHRSKEFYSFNGNTQTFDIHNAQVRTIYGNIEESYVEFVFNPSPNVAKVTDYLNIISNEIAPKQIDLYTYNVDTYKEDVLDESKMFQHAVIEQGIDIFTEENRIRLRDRKFVAQVPHVKYINDIDWGQGRMRNKYVIIRLTYETDQKVEVLSVITDYRISAS